ncbi:MAG: SRPBCC family protein [Terracidiphilus sp.]|nr:SRPBCC family protein [Terracidiphilus sp.]
MKQQENGQFESAQWVPYPVELVFAFFANPANLAHLMAPGLKTRMEDLRVVPAAARPVAADPARRFQSMAAGVGSEIAISFRPVPWIPFRLRWRARIVEFVWNSHFADEQVRGPFAVFHHRHGIEAEARDGVEGTLVSDRIEFALPGGRVGAMANGLARRELRQQFAVRQERLPVILADALRQAVRRAGA